LRLIPYLIEFVRVLFRVGAWGLVSLGVAVLFGIGWWADYLSVRTSLNPLLKARLGIDMPSTLPWLLIASVFVLAALVRLVHRQVMSEAVTPRLSFSEPQFVWTNLETIKWEGTPRPIHRSEPIAIGFVEVSNKPRSRVGGLPAEKAWATAKFTNLHTGEAKKIRFCRWTDNPKPRPDEHQTTLLVRYKSDWNSRTLEANGIPNRLDFFVRHLGGCAYGFQAASQENDGWINEDHRLWMDAPIRVDLRIDAGNLDRPAMHAFIVDFSTHDGIEFRSV